MRYKVEKSASLEPKHYRPDAEGLYRNKYTTESSSSSSEFQQSERLVTNVEDSYTGSRHGNAYDKMLI